MVLLLVQLKLLTLTISDTLTANTINATLINCDDIRGDLYGDVYTPDGVKVFENGPGGGLPATFTGNVLGTVSSLTNHDTNALVEGANNFYFTTARARASLSGGTGVSYDSANGIISIGQSVGEAADVLFNTVSATGRHYCICFCF